MYRQSSRDALTAKSDVEERQTKLRDYLLLDFIIMLNMTGKLLAANQKFLSKWKPGGLANEVCLDVLCASLPSCNLNAYSLF